MPEDLTHAEVLGRYVGTFVDEIVAAGVENVCMCPGSRSTPLALTFERHPGIKTWIHLDERSCAYFALGMAKASGRLVAILCSSGTAAVNFAPAVVEAFHSHVPLIVLTADRPPELQGLGANQTIDQANLYGSAVKWFTQTPLPEASEHMLRYARIVADRAVATALEGPRGPVHINLPFREPLIPAPVDFQSPQVRPSASTALPATFQLDDLLSARRPLVVCGPESGLAAADVDRLAATLNAPILTDPVSGARQSTAAGIIGTHDYFLRDAELARKLRPDYVLRFGAPATGRPLATYLQTHRDVCQLQVAAPGQWPDPDLNAHAVVHADAASVCSAITAGSADPAWLQAWQQVEAATSAVVASALPEADPTEPSTVIDLANVLPSGATLVAGNSMPVRDFDSFLPAGTPAGAILGNRGASGIDGVVSSALGVASVSDGPTVLVIGDLSFYHDMNGLLAAKRFGLNATIVLINNDGGGIFSFLPQHDDAEHFETLWGTPHGLDFSHVAGLYGVGFQRVTTREEYKAALKASFWADGVQVIEIKTDREENLKLHQRIWDEVAIAVNTVTLA